MQHISQFGTGTEALRQVVLFSPKKGGISSCLKESTAWVLHNAYKLIALFLLLSPIRCLGLSLRISSAQHPFLFGLIHLDSASIPPSFHLPLCLLPCLSPDSMLDRARPC